MRVIGTSSTAYRNALYYETEDGLKGSIVAPKSVPFEELWRRALIREGYEIDEEEEEQVEEPVASTVKEDSSDSQRAPQEKVSERAGKSKSRRKSAENQIEEL